MIYDNVLKMLKENVKGEMIVLKALHENGSMNKERLKRCINEIHNETNGCDKYVSRIAFDVALGKLEAVGAVTSQSYGRVRVYSIEDFAYELIGGVSNE